MLQGRWFRPRPAITNCVYEWQSWRGWYVAAVLPDALRLRARAQDRAEELVESLPDSVRRFLFHIDMTRTDVFPSERVSLVRLLERREIQPCNLHATDLSKRYLHEICSALALPSAKAAREGDPEEMLFVKTDANYGGRSERLLGTFPKNCPVRNAFDYRALRRKEVPADWWASAPLAIENFISNREDRIFRVRVSLDRRIYCTGTSAKPLKKLSDCTNLEAHFLRAGDTSACVPRALMETSERIIAAYGLDFGAIDLIPDDEGRFYCIDVNATPGMGRGIPEWIRFLREPWN